MVNFFCSRNAQFAAAIFVVTAHSGEAHSGRTDKRGGHHDRKNGGYHFHHGYGPHQHPNGICPYSSESIRNTDGKSSKGQGGSNLLLVGGAVALGFGLRSLIK